MTRIRACIAGMLSGALLAGAAVAGDNFEPAWRVIFPAAKAREFTRQCSRISPGPVTDVWTPTAADIDAMEPALAKLLASKLATVDGGHYATTGDYYRQYAGLVIGGRRIIYVGGVHKSAVMDTRPEYRDLWRTQAVMICDGGPIVFGVEYDPTTKTFANFAFNGAI